MMVYAGHGTALPAGTVFVSRYEPPEGTVVPTASISHGGVDNDAATMSRVLKRPPKKPFTTESLKC